MSQIRSVQIVRNKLFPCQIDEKKFKKQLKLMSGVISQLILIQPTIERVALSHQKSAEMVYSTTVFAGNWKFLARTEKKISTVGAVTRNRKTSFKPVLDPNRLSSWNKLLLILATIFNITYRAKKIRSDKCQNTD